ncbi:DUF1203 domain-containing protein [Xaviernesmea rhizosphaerae]|uniref:DUF1203 domain-containing protein n=1 Tax=Xaviernesmea rhizosphaerae TaxID=1672749 RepID=UPI003159BC2D
MCAERREAAESGLPCRHCLRPIAAGTPYLTLAYRPFYGLHPYAETGPVFLHAELCARYDDGATLPPVLLASPDYLVKAYGKDERIVYGTGRITASADIADHVDTLLQRPDIAFVDIRSARNNCLLCRVVRAQ